MYAVEAIGTWLNGPWFLSGQFPRPPRLLSLTRRLALTDDPAKMRAWVRYLGIITGVGIGILAFVIYLIPYSTVGVIVAGLAGLMVVGAGSQFLFHGATLISQTLQGDRRTYFQVGVSLAVPILFMLFLASYTDGVPVETLRTIATPWLLIPLGIISWLCWFLAGHMDREHPFRAFLIAAAVIGVLCWLWTMGMASDSDSGDEGGSGFYIDKEQRQRARETGEYVWRFVLYTAAAYLALFTRLQMRTSSHDEALLKLNDTLTPEAVEHVVSTIGGFIADREARPAREADLPFPKVVIELAYIKAMRSCTDPKRLNLLKAVYVTLDDYMLSDEDCALMRKYREFWEQARFEPPTDQSSVIELARKFDTPDMKRAQAISKRLTEAMHKRGEVTDKIKPSSK